MANGTTGANSAPGAHRTVAVQNSRLKTYMLVQMGDGSGSRVFV